MRRTQMTENFICRQKVFGVIIKEIRDILGEENYLTNESCK